MPGIQNYAILALYISDEKWLFRDHLNVNWDNMVVCAVVDGKKNPNHEVDRASTPARLLSELKSCEPYEEVTLQFIYYPPNPGEPYVASSFSIWP
jgi:hypothetical protein